MFLRIKLVAAFTIGLTCASTIVSRHTVMTPR